MQAHRTPNHRRELVLTNCTSRIRLPVRELRWRDDCPDPPPQPCTEIPDILRWDDQSDGVRRVTSPGYFNGRPSHNRGKKFPPTPPSPEEVVAIINAMPDTPVGRRNRALTIVLWRAGLRISEALALIPSDINLRDQTITVQCGKGGKRRIVGIDAQACTLVAAWLEERTHIGCMLFQPVFCSVHAHRRGGRMHSATYRDALHLAARKAGVPNRVAPHQLRHAMACELAREGVNIPVLSRQLGHSNIATTSTYLQGITPLEVIDAMSTRMWPGATPDRRRPNDPPFRPTATRIVAPAETPESMFDRMSEELA